ncbi:MAG: glycoside hydrolase family 127 protein [Candidatus Omnitrophota bacterium]|jgi:DUF1680 family protein|nr:MAG: glycoside hydrolase family 127 protein [Candidatus Omnitrophota bacterium]
MCFLRFFSLLPVLSSVLVVAAEKEIHQLSAVPFSQVTLTDEFWSPRLQTTREITLPHCLDWCETTGRISNFAKAGGTIEGKFEGIYFNDSDVYKVLEGAAYILANDPEPRMQQKINELITKIAGAQQENGYLNTYYTLVEPDKRWSDLRVKHELYCAGHLFEAAVAHYQATGEKVLLDVACKFADLIDSIFGPDKRRDVPGHEEIELALVKLSKVTGERKYLDLAKFFIEERGQARDRELYGKDLQDHLPVREQSDVVGHAVRAMYLFSGVADIVAETGDRSYVDAMKRIWLDLTTRKMYITGGIGVSGHGEGFSAGYDLPNEKAYAETCAAIALAFFSSRMNRLFADASYADVFERVLYNGLLSGVSLDGDKFFYINPLASRGVDRFETSGGRQGDSAQHRQHWFSCACCPSNVVRFLPSIGSYMYAHSDHDIYVNLYIDSQSTLALADSNVNITQKTRYPWDGKIKIVMEPEKVCAFDVYLRIPAWCADPEMKVNGKQVDLDLRRGYARVSREWKRKNTIELNLPMEIQRIEAHPEVKNNVGKVALQRGPIVYCLEEEDNGRNLQFISLKRDGNRKAAFRPDLLNGIVVITGEAYVNRHSGEFDSLYRIAPEPLSFEFTAIPYYAWDNRTPGEMLVWLPQDPALAAPMTFSNCIRPSASHVNRKGEFEALSDQVLPKNSGDKDIPRFTWWNHKGTREWVQYDLQKDWLISGVEVYWFDDRESEGGCRAPQSWKLLWKDGDRWKAMENVGDYGVELDQFNRITFPPIQTSALRIEVELQPEFSGGILEWRVF